MKVRKPIIFAVLLSIIFSLCGCSDLRNTFSLLGDKVEKSEKNAYEFTVQGEKWQFVGDITDENKNEVYFFSSDESVAKVSEYGTVIPVSDGSALITAAYRDGSKMFSARIKVAFADSANTQDSDKTKNLRGVWVSTVWNIDFPSESGLNEEKLKKELDGIMENAASWGLNAVFLQVRPMSDSIYPSSVFPSSSFVTKKQGDKLPFDILEYAVKKAHENGLELHAWINPFRISFSSLYKTDISKLSPENPAAKHPEYTVEYKNALYYNPGLPEVRQLVLDEITEIVSKYDVDGIHFDDYFYPSGSGESGSFDDSDAFEKYGNGKTLSDWRRENINTLIKEVSETVKKNAPNCRFGVSPGGIWATAQNNDEGVSGLGNTSQTYYDVFADTKKWVEEKSVDYICPQIYWNMENSVAPFGPIASWWSELCEKSGVDLYVGIAAYRGEDTAAYQSPEEIKNELSYLQTLSKYDGEVYFSYSSLKNNLAGVVSTIKEVYSAE